MFKKYYLITLLCLTFKLNAENLNYIRTCIIGHCFDSRLADTPVKRAKGLMGELSLPRDEGMLFIFPNEGNYEFWMKNTKIPLDILFINDNDIIVYMVKNAQPCQTKKCPVYKTTRKASKVLEINAGLSKKYNFHVGLNVEYFIEDV